MIVEAGHFALLLAMALAVLQSLLPLVGAARRDARLMATGPTLAVGLALFTGLSFAALTAAYVGSDFSVLNVVENSHSAKPLIFKISGVWGNHEGSMLLWVLILTLFGAAVGVFGGNLPASLRANVLAVQGWISAAFLAFILFTSNPFARVLSPPIEGNDLNPVLQDIGLAIHPPLLYLGYVGFSVSFAFAVAALIDGRIDAAWARWVRPWTLAAWIFLTLGISMGSYWAYYELGWGGWWFWDPVENASFMPWLLGTALLHSALVMEKRNALKVWTVLLAILTFSLSLLGTFLVRSGVLTSVHAFASDPTRGVFILVILCAFIGGGLSLFAWRASSLQQGGLFAPVSREGALVLNNLLLAAATATVLVGTLYPLALEALTGAKISVGAPFFNLTFGPLMVPLLIALPFGPMLAWKRGDLAAALSRLMAALAVALLAALAAAWLTGGGPVLAVLALGLAAFVIAGAVTDFLARARFREVGLSVGLKRLAGLPRSVHGTALAHAGLGVTMVGIVAVSAFQVETITVLRIGESAMVGRYEITLDSAEDRRGPNYVERVAHMTARSGGIEVTRLDPSRRIYTARGMPTTEAAIYTHGFSQLYVTLGEEEVADGGFVVRLFDKPLVTLIWLGTLVMAAGGVLSLSDRRLRVGAPRRAAVPPRPPAPAAAT